MKNKFNVFLIVGQFSVTAGILLQAIPNETTPFIDFLSGMLIGLSIAFNFAYIIKNRYELKNQQQ